MAHEVATMEQAEGLQEEVKRLKILYRIALDIKKGVIPVSFSKKGAELASKYEGEQLEEYAYGGY